jgi:hypothetical protein
MMPQLRWETFVADAEGVVDYARVRSLVSVLLAVAGGVALTLAMAGLIEPGEYVALGTSAMILPITAGKVTDVLAARAAAKVEP